MHVQHRVLHTSVTALQWEAAGHMNWKQYSHESVHIAHKGRMLLTVKILGMWGE